MKKTVAIVGCLDTKGAELQYMRDVLAECGLQSHVIDTGVLGEPATAADTPREATARAAGSSLEELRAKNDRGHAMETMCRGAEAIVRELFSQGRIHGILAAGGSANTTVATAAMRTLPVGFPKVMVSTLASGDVSPYVDTKDITMMYSVVDIAGLNRLSSRILANAARAVAGMVSGEDAKPAPESGSTPDAGRAILSATMFGVTTPCVTEAKRILDESDYEVVVFHATGTGGRAMEGLIADGFVQGVIDITTTELADELVGGILSAGPDRLRAAGRAGIPQVVSIGAVDMVNFGPRDTVPEAFRDRKFYQHNPTVTLMRTSPDENEEIGRRIAQRLNESKGPVRILLPLRGVSLISKPGEAFADDEADRRCREAIKQHIRADLEVQELDMDINDPAFARACAEALQAML